jgi:hypothetical protein
VWVWSNCQPSPLVAGCFASARCCFCCRHVLSVVGSPLLLVFLWNRGPCGSFVSPVVSFSLPILDLNIPRLPWCPSRQQNSELSPFRSFPTEARNKGQNTTRLSHGAKRLSTRPPLHLRFPSRNVLVAVSWPLPVCCLSVCLSVAVAALVVSLALRPGRVTYTAIVLVTSVTSPSIPPSFDTTDTTQRMRRHVQKQETRNPPLSVPAINS